MKKFRAPALQVSCKIKDGKVVSIMSLLFAALEVERPLTIKKRSGYLEAMRNLVESKDSVMLEESTA